MSITVPNPFSSKDVMLHEELCEVIQEILYYAESRFRVILNVISRADIDKKNWTEVLLKRELVCFPAFMDLVSNSYI
jgi:hypothetical protein